MIATRDWALLNFISGNGTGHENELSMWVHFGKGAHNSASFKMVWKGMWLILVKKSIWEKDELPYLTLREDMVRVDREQMLVGKMTADKWESFKRQKEFRASMFK